VLSVDLRQLKQFERDLEALHKRGLPQATRQAVNDLAWKARAEWQEELKESFTLRNQFTGRSIRVEPARSSKITDQQSVVGSVAPYMLTQEEGGVLTGKGGASKPVPTTAARIGKSEQRLVSRPNRMQSIRLQARHGQGERQRNAIQIELAKRSGRKFAYIEKGRKRGIFRVTGGKRATRLTLLQNLSHRSVTIRPQLTMQPAVERALAFGPLFYRDALLAELARARSFKR
jgi:hypothetical protein